MGKSLAINTKIQSVTAFAPATVGNFIVGYDLLGCAVDTIGDEVTLSRHDSTGVIIKEIIGANQLPLDPQKNVAAFVIEKFCYDYQLPNNFSVVLKKGIPLGSGMGGSAASAVASLVALNQFLNEPVNLLSLLPYAIEAEGLASGTPHADNVVPCLFGGLTLTRNIDPIEVIQLPIPNWQCVLVHPELTVKTKDAREILPEKMPLKTYIQQSDHLASFIVALYEGRNDLLNTVLQDVLVEPYRSRLVKGFDDVKLAAIKNGAYGASLSGSGPTILAITKDYDTAIEVKEAMIHAFSLNGVNSEGWISAISNRAARYLHVTSE